MIVYPGTYFSIENENYTVNQIMNFDSITIASDYIIFNNTGFYISSENDITINLVYINEDINNALEGEKVLEFYANTNSGNVWFNISGFPVGYNYIVDRSGSTIATCAADIYGNISFSNSVWSSNLFKIFLEPLSSEITLKWYVDTSVYTNLSKEYSSSTLPVAANVDDDPQMEIFYGLGIDSGGGNPTGKHYGSVVCLDGVDGSLEWYYNSDGFGRHTTLELGDTDQDGELELLAGGMKNVVCFDARTGQIEWEYWVDPPYTDDRRKDKHSIILKDTDGETYVFMSGNSNLNEPVIKFAGSDTSEYDPGDIIKEDLLSVYTCHGGFACWDIDNDGDFDLFNTDRTTGNGLYWLDTNLTVLDSWNTVWCSSHCPTIIDVNDDGYLDIVITDQSGDGICIVDGQTKSPMAGKWQENIPGFGAHDNNNIYDIDGDGNLELISGDNVITSGADIFDLEDWQLESYSPLWADSGVGYSHPLAIGNVWQSGNGNEMELIGFTSGNGRGYLVIYQWNSSAQNFDIKQTLNVYLNQMIVQDIDNDGLNEIIGMGVKAISGSNCRGTIQVFDSDGANTGYRTWNQWYSERRTGAPGDYGPSLAPLETNTQNETLPNFSSNNIKFSNPKDTDSNFGWENISVNVISSTNISAVSVNITYPDNTIHNFSLNNMGGTNQYYINTTFSQSGNHSYYIWANDSNGNNNYSNNFYFSIPPNWDINSDGICSVFDYVLISNLYDTMGYPGWVREDVDNNGDIQLLDFATLSDTYGYGWLA